MSIVPHPAGWGEMATGNLGDFFGGADLRTATAVIDLSGGRERQFDYRAYANKIDAVAEMLMRHGLARGARVAILGRNSTEYLAAYFGIMKAGFVAVPINHKFPKEMVGYVVDDAGVDRTEERRGGKGCVSTG